MPAALEAPPAAPSPNSTVSEAAAQSAALGAGSGNRNAFTGNQMASAFDDLEKRGKPGGTAEKETIPPHPAQKKTEVEKPAPKPDEKTAPSKTADELKAEADKAAQDKPAEKTETKPGETAKPKKPSDYLREEMTKWKTKAETYEAEIKKLKETPVEHPEIKSLTEKLTAAEKRAAEFEENLRFTNYERSNEFKTKYEEPFVSAYKHGRTKTAGLKIVELKNPDTGDLVRASRPATGADFDTIMAAPNDEAAIDMIENMFGTGTRSQIVTHAREKVLEFHTARQQALENAGKTSAEREKQTSDFYSKLNKEITSLWESNKKSEALPDKHKKWFTPAEGDAEEKSTLEAGYKFVDKVNAEDARNPNLSSEARQEIVGRAAAYRHRAAVFPLLTKRLEKSQARIAELEASLKAFEDSEPGEGDGKRGDSEVVVGGSAMDSVMSSLEKRGKPMYH